MENLIVVAGPTASGKTKLAVEIAKKYNGELINADSRQIYKYLDIGTNKGELRIKNEELTINEVPIHLVSFLNPDEKFEVFSYKKLAEEKIEEIRSRGKLPILVGGTGLYIDAIIKDYDFEKSEELRIKNEVDHMFLYMKYDWEELKEKIDNRVQWMFENGLVEETEKVLEMGFAKDSVGLQTMGYKEVIKYLNAEITLEEAIELTKIAHRQYAKRQRTWFEAKDGRNYDLKIVENIKDIKL